MAVNSKAIGVAYEDQQIISGQIDDTVIGSVTPNVGTFTNLYATGNVGIGTSNPSFKLHVSGSGTQTIAAVTSDTSGVAVGRLRAVYTGGGGGVASAVDLRAGDGYALLNLETNAALLFGTNNAERMRITAAGNQIATQAAESAQNASVTLTVANLQARIITSNAAVTLTLPTGTSLESYTSGMAVDTAFECVFIATTANAITIAANGNTTVGSLTVAGNTSGTFRFRKTAANTFTVYRVA